MTLAVMGCVVNGPGESKAASIGISLPGTGEAPNCPVYIDGQHSHDAARDVRGARGGIPRARRQLRRHEISAEGSGCSGSRTVDRSRSRSRTPAHSRCPREFVPGPRRSGRAGLPSSSGSSPVSSRLLSMTSSSGSPCGLGRSDLVRHGTSWLTYQPRRPGNNLFRPAESRKPLVDTARLTAPAGGPAATTRPAARRRR